MLIDLHTHTCLYSGCSILKPQDLVLFVQKTGIHGLAITEHNYLWRREEIENLRRKYPDFLLLRGQEVDTDCGHILVYGYPEALKGTRSHPRLIEEVRRRGGAVVLAHPFRWGFHRLGGRDDLRAFFSLFDAIEIFNSNLTQEEICRGEKCIQDLGLPATGGSDAHAPFMLGRFATDFVDRIADEQQLAQAIRQGICRPVVISS